MSNAIKQHEARVKTILARRGNPSYKEPEVMHTGITPVKQAEAMAQKVLAKQGKTVPTPEADTVEATYTEVDYSTLTKKDLKKMLDAEGIAYPKKATNEALITLIKG